MWELYWEGSDAMKNVVLAAALAAAMFGAVSGAHAAKVVTLTSPAADGSFTGTFTDTGLGLGGFSESFTFQMPTGIAGATISTNFTTDQSNNIDFSSAAFNGHALNLTPNGQVEFGSLVGVPVTSGTQTLVVNGSSGGNGSFSGTLSFERIVVPEPAAWAMMIVGFGGIGAGIRRKRRTAMGACVA